MGLEEIIDVAQGRREPDLVLRGAGVVNVFTGEILPGDVAVYGGRIAGVGAYDGGTTEDLQGALLCPGFFDGHVHIESSMVQVAEYARAVVPRGTTSVIIDPHEIANVLGSDGILYMLRSSKYNPLNVYMMLPSCVPATARETAGSELKALDLFPFLSDRWVLGLGEMMDYLGVLDRDPDVLDKIKIMRGKRIDGHAPGLSGRPLAAYVAAGIQSDHETTTVEEAREKIRLGMRIFLREGSSSKNLVDLLPLVSWENGDRFVFCTDDRHPGDLMEEGHIDFMIRTAVRHGVDPALAVRLATLNPAHHYGLNRLGAIAPGYEADLAVLEDFDTCRVRRVYKSGTKVAEDGRAVYTPPPAPRFAPRSSMNVGELTEETFHIPAEGAKANVIGLIPHQLITRHLRVAPAVEDGRVLSDPERDLIRLYMIERHHASGNVGRGLIQGLHLERGALASSVAHDSHNLIVAGVSDADLLLATAEVVRRRGGLAVVADGEVLASLPLPIAGLMSDRPLGEVRAGLDAVHEAARSLGVTVDDPMAVLSFLGLTVIPELKLSDLGLVEVNRGSLLGLFQEPAAGGGKTA